MPLPSDPEEEMAIERAAERFKEFFPSHPAPRSIVYALVSAWIVERVRLSVRRTICGDIVFNLGDSHVRGAIESLLPEIGAQLSHLPPDKPFFDLPKDQVLDILAIGYHAGRSGRALLDDEIPFP